MSHKDSQTEEYCLKKNKNRSLFKKKKRTFSHLIIGQLAFFFLQNEQQKHNMPRKKLQGAPP